MQMVRLPLFQRKPYLPPDSKFRVTKKAEQEMSTSKPPHTALQSAAEEKLPKGVMASLALSMLLPSLGTSIANVALPTFAEAFSASFQQVQWVVLAYLLATTTLIVGVGRLGDLFGRRQLFMFGVVIFTAASFFASLCSRLDLLIAARALQGTGAAILMALPMAFVGAVVPKSRTGGAMGMLGTMSAVGTALGPSLGGLLIAKLGWQSIFLVNVPLGVLALVLARRYLPAEQTVPNPAKTGFDKWGMLLLALTLATYSLAMTMGRGNFGQLNILLLLAAGMGLGMFIWAERNTASPLIRLSMFRDPVLSASLLMSALVSTVMMATLIVGPFYLGLSLQLNTGIVGAVMSTGPIAAALTGVPAGRIVDRFGAQRATTVGLFGMFVGCFALSMLPQSWGAAGYVIPIVVITSSYALFQSANNTAVMVDAQPETRGLTSGMLNLSRNLGLITGASVMGAVFAMASGTVNFGHADTAVIASGMRTTFTVATVLVLGALVAAAVSRALARSGRRTCF
ncbi:MAG: MFS transporter [Hydrogenophaga sp.]|nr:MFS transporter [Hydrogenophaga sp.]